MSYLESYRESLWADDWEEEANYAARMRCFSSHYEALKQLRTHLLGLMARNDWLFNVDSCDSMLQLQMDLQMDLLLHCFTLENYFKFVNILD